MISHIYSKLTLEKIAIDFPNFARCKDTIFSQMLQAFYEKYQFAKNILHLILSIFAQNSQYEDISRIAFFANDLAIFYCCIKSKTATSESHYSDFYRLLFLDGRNIFYAGITFCTERINVNPVFFPHYEFCKSLAHTFILYISEHTFKNAIVHSCSNGLHQFHYLIATFVVADVVGHYVEMFTSHLTLQYLCYHFAT